MFIHMLKDEVAINIAFLKYSITSNYFSFLMIKPTVRIYKLHCTDFILITEVAITNHHIIRE